MKKSPFINALLISSVVVSSSVIAAGGPRHEGRSAPSELTTTEIDDLRFMREEEKLARDVYLTLDQHWGDQTQVFAKIAISEETHTSTVEYLLDKFGVEDPVVNDTIGVFTNAELQALYDDLVIKGKSSFLDGLYVGGLIEEKDMRDILAAINETDERAITLAYSNLLDGSKSHLKAFVAVIEAQGLDYEAQILEPEEVELILEDDGQVES